MLVKELIEFLKTQPQEMRVVRNYENDTYVLYDDFSGTGKQVEIAEKIDGLYMPFESFNDQTKEKYKDRKEIVLLIE